MTFMEELSYLWDCGYSWFYTYIHVIYVTIQSGIKFKIVLPFIQRHICEQTFRQTLMRSCLFELLNCEIVHD